VVLVKESRRGAHKKRESRRGALNVKESRRGAHKKRRAVVVL
jgi:hypothetical protein